jgi:hypothetical protein
MILLFQNAEFFCGEAVLPENLNTATHEDFDLFDPHHPLGMRGSYKSINCPLTHYEYITLIMRVADTYTRDILMLGLVYDFIAYASERLRRRVQSRKIIRADRVVLRKQILTLANSKLFRGYHTMTQIFLAISAVIRPPTKFPLTPPTKPSRGMKRVEQTHADEISDNPELSDIETDLSMDDEWASEIMYRVDEDNTKPHEATPNTQYAHKTAVKQEVVRIPKGKEYRDNRNKLNFPRTPIQNTPTCSSAQDNRDEYKNRRSNTGTPVYSSSRERDAMQSAAARTAGRVGAVKSLA